MRTNSIACAEVRDSSVSCGEVTESLVQVRDCLVPFEVTDSSVFSVEGRVQFWLKIVQFPV